MPRGGPGGKRPAGAAVPLARLPHLLGEIAVAEFAIFA